MTVALPDVTGRALKACAFRHVRADQQIISEPDRWGCEPANHARIIHPLIADMMTHHEIHQAIGKDRLCGESGPGVEIKRCRHGVVFVNDGDREPVTGHTLGTPGVRRLNGMRVDHGEVGHHAGIQSALLEHDSGRMEGVVADDLVDGGSRSTIILLCRGTVHKIGCAFRDELP